MNPVNATSLYVSASRSVLQCDPRDPRALAELCKLLPFFRQSLSCLVCGNLLQDPIAPTDSSCQHYVCRGCKGQRMQLKPSCSWCKDYSRFQENRQLSLLVHCYRKLCLYIAQSPLAPHIASAAGDSPDLQAILNEGLTLAESEQQDAAEDATDLSDGQLQDGGAAPSSFVSHEVRPAEAEAPPAVVEVKVENSPSRVAAAGVNGLHDCNGLVEPDALQPIAIDTGGGGGVLKSEVFEDQLPVCVSVTAGGDAGLCEITAFGEELKHSGGSLLLSVEEVLRTLETADPDPDPQGPQPDCDPPVSVPHASLNGPHCPLGPDSSRHTPSLPPENSPRPLQPHPYPQPSLQPPPHPQPSPQPPPQPSPAIPCAPSRCHRKRSRSESDSEKVQPLPIASLLRGGRPPPPLGANNNSPHHHHHHLLHHHHHHHLGPAAAKREPKFPSPGTIAPPHHPHLAPVPNGGPPKVGKTVLVSSKGLKKAVEHHGGQKKAYAKARQGVPKPRAQPRDRMPPHPHPHPLSHPPSPSKPLYKKPVEKKGCKCGRATQNPSVLTCRGQRCPCYSNRKACLDCICRGCQNSYMANGEKKLEAFAVPEKALEQTRLTLGINLTSITAAALRSPVGPTSAPSGGNALINVAGTAGTAAPAVTAAAFISGGAGHDSRAFDDSLEMRFDC